MNRVTYEASMKATKRAFAAAEMMLILPAVLFMTALFMRNVQPLRFEPAHTAQEIVAWLRLDRDSASGCFSSPCRLRY